jgi:hypothetical protein
MARLLISAKLQISSLGLIALDCLKQALEIACPEARKVMSLDDLNENRRSIHQWLGRLARRVRKDYLRKKLQQIPAAVEVNKDI